MSQTLGQTKLAYARAWHLIDIGRPYVLSTPSNTALTTTPEPLGRLATRIALTLMGKHKPIYSPATDCGDYVVAVGCSDIHVTGKKRDQKLYRTHTTRPGSLKEISMDGLVRKLGGGEVLRRAVRGMLPKNKLRDKRLARLKVFEGLAHPYKKNLLRWNGREEGIAGLEGVKEAFEAEKLLEEVRS